MKLIPIPVEKYDEYRLDLMFDCYKWDPQFEDHNTVAKHVLVLSQKEYQELKELTENLDIETRSAEEFLNKNLEYAKLLDLPKKLTKEIESMKNYDANKHIRLMRYDFHPIKNGWAISEVNSDVPGGFAEGSFMPRLAKEALNDNSYWFVNFGEIIVKTICEKVKPNGKIMMDHCTCFSDDRQVMQFLGDRLSEKGFEVLYGAADHIRFKDKKAISILDGNEGEIDAIIRFNPLSWVKEIKPKYWDGYFNTETVSCNHPIAIFAQTKRFPFVWNVLEKNGISMSTWKKLLPETIEVKDAKGKKGYIYKPAEGRVGEKISIVEACSKKEYKEIMTEVMLFPKRYVAQKKFESMPIKDENGKEYHVCLGSYTVDGAHAGFYARVSNTPRIDSNAADIPVLIEGGIEDDK